MKFNTLIFIQILVFVTFFANAQLFDRYANFSEEFDARNTGLTTLPLLSIPMGGEHEALGTSTTGIGRDISFIESNPSMSSQLEYTSLSVFHKNWIADSSIEGLAYTTRFDDLGISGFTKFLHVPFTAYDRYGIQQASVRYTETVAGFNIAYNLFDSFHFDGLNVGTTAKFGHARIPPQLYDDELGTQNTSALVVDLGISTSFDILKQYRSRKSNFHIGASLLNIGFTNQNDDPLPSQWRGGIGYYPLNWLLITSDLIVPFTLDDTPSEPVAWSTGTSVNVTEFVQIMSGLYVRGGNPRISLGSSIDLTDATIFLTYTLDATTQALPDKLSAEVRFSLGDRNRARRQQRVETMYLDALAYFSQGHNERAESLLERVVTLDPEFTPAQQTLEIVQEQRELEERMLDIRAGELLLSLEER